MNSLFVSLVYCAESTVCWFVVREKQLLILLAGRKRRNRDTQ
jgi:hypothetical protein